MLLRRGIFKCILIQMLLINVLFHEFSTDPGSVRKDLNHGDLVEKSLGENDSLLRSHSKSLASPDKSYHSPCGDVKSQHAWLALHYEFCPRNLTVIAGFIAYGDISGTHRFDNKSLLFLSGNYSGSYRVEVLVDFLLTREGQIVLCCSGMNVNLIVEVFNYSIGIYVGVINLTFNGCFNGSIFNFTNSVAKLSMRIKFDSTRFFNVSLHHLVGITYPIDVPLDCYWETPSRLCCKLVTDRVWSGTKIVIKNATKFMMLKSVLGPPVAYNFSERSLRILSDGFLEIHFTRYDVWNFTGNDLELTLNFISGTTKIDVGDLNVSYRITCRKPVSVDTNAPVYECWITLFNPNSYDLFGVPVKIVVNNSWLNLFAIDQTLSDMLFYLLNGTQTIRLGSYLHSWDGRNAIFYLKIPCIGAFNKRLILLRYGGAPTNFHNDLSAKDFGYTLREISNSSLWKAAAGSVYVRFDEALKAAEILLRDMESPIFTKATFLGRISGATCGVFRVVSYLAINEYWLVEYYLIYINDGNFVKLTLKKETQLNLIEMKIVQRKCGLDKILHTSYSNIRYPLDHTLTFEVRPLQAKLFVDVFFSSDNQRSTVSVDIDVDLIKSGWHITLAVGNITHLKLLALSWNQSIDQHVFMLEISENRLICNITSQLLSTPWQKLNDSKIFVPPSSTVELKIFDAFGNEISYLQSDLSGLNSFNINININTPIMKLINKEVGIKEFYISTLNKSLKIRLIIPEVKSLVISPGHYLLEYRELSSGNFSLIIADFSELEVFEVDVTSLKALSESIMRCSRLKLIGLIERRELRSISLPNASFFMLCTSNYSSLTRIVIQFSKILFSASNRVLSSNMVREFDRLDELVVRLAENARPYGVVTAVNINLLEGELSYTDSSGLNHIDLNQSQIALISALLEISQIFRYAKYLLNIVLDCPDEFLREVAFDSYKRIMTIKCVDNLASIVVNYATGNIHVVSSWAYIDSYLKYLILGFDLAHIIGGIKSALTGVGVLDKLYLEATLNNRSLNAILKISTKSELECFFMDLVACLVTVSRPDLGGITVSFNALSDILMICGRNVDSHRKLLFFAQDCLLGGQKFGSFWDKDAALAAYSTSVIKRSIELIDYYSLNPIAEGLVTLKINNTILVKSNFIEFWTLSGAITVIDMWDIMGNSLEKNLILTRDKNRLMIKLGSIIILNDLRKEVTAKVRSNESACLEIPVQGKSYITLLLKTNIYYNVQLFSDGVNLLNTTILLTGSNEERPSFLVLVYEQGHGGSHAPTNNAGLGGFNIDSFRISGEYAVLIILSVIIACAAFITKKILGKIRERQVVSVERLIESLVRESNDESALNQTRVESD